MSEETLRTVQGTVRRRRTPTANKKEDKKMEEERKKKKMIEKKKNCKHLDFMINNTEHRTEGGGGMKKHKRAPIKIQCFPFIIGQKLRGVHNKKTRYG